MDTPGVIQSIVLFILLILSAFFSSAETAFSTLNHVHIRTMVDEGDKRAVIVSRILDNYGKMISAILVGNNIVNLTASALATTLALRINLTVGIATGILTLLVLIFGEIVPKTWAKINNEKIALRYCKIIYALMIGLTPVIAVINFLAGILLRIMGADPSVRPDAITETELKSYVDVSHEDGMIEKEERKMIFNVFDFSDAEAQDIMIPRIKMVTVDDESSYQDVLKVFRESMYTRIPVYHEDPDNIIGLINIKDFILTKKTDFSVASILRDAHYTYEFKKTSDLMMEMREKSSNVAFVINEYGATVGMITMEDLLEEIVGEIRDEYDEDEKELIKHIEDRTYLVEGTMKLDDINEALGTSFESEDFDSIAGIVIQALDDRLPEDNEEVVLEDGTILKVQGVDQNRITNVLMTLPESQDENDDDLDDEDERDTGDKDTNAKDTNGKGSDADASDDNDSAPTDNADVKLSNSDDK